MGISFHYCFLLVTRRYASTTILLQFHAIAYTNNTCRRWESCISHEASIVPLVEYRVLLFLSLAHCVLSQMLASDVWALSPLPERMKGAGDMVVRHDPHCLPQIICAVLLHSMTGSSAFLSLTYFWSKQIRTN